MSGAQWSHYTLPDITVWTYPGEHHEIKHKEPTRRGQFGLEVYRYEALIWFAKETKQDVLYTIHNHALSGGRNARENSIEHWLTVNIVALDGRWAWHGPGWSWVNGKKKSVALYYWPAGLWTPLVSYWGVSGAYADA
jgi:hypothetical protein